MIPTPLGASRTTVRPLYALIAPDSHVPSVEPGWTKSVPFVLVSAGMGARITETLYAMDAGGRGTGETGGNEHFYYVVDGACAVNDHDLSKGGFAYLPSGEKFDITSKSGAKVLLFAKRYEVLAGTGAPKALFGDEKKVKSEPFLGDPAEGVFKQLRVEYAIGDVELVKRTYEGGTLLITEPSTESKTEAATPAK